MLCMLFHCALKPCLINDTHPPMYVPSQPPCHHQERKWNTEVHAYQL
jgi:hypothetical protein